MLGRLVNSVLHIVGLHMQRHETVKYLNSKGRYLWLKQHGVKTVIDVGANIGQFAKFANAILPFAAIYSFEPLPDQFIRLKVLEKKISTLKCFPFALGSTEEEKPIHVNDWSPSSSILPITDLHVSSFPFTKNSNEQTITIKTLDSILSSLQLEAKILLKIDVQGYEMEVLKGALRSLELIDIVIVETSFRELYKGQPFFADIYEFMVARGFGYFGNFDQILNTVNGEVLQADAIFIKRSI